jgi:predicted metal-dependent phosphoesterase TrpH
VFAIDLHAHTRFFHGHPRAAAAFDPVGARLLAWAARARGLDGVALTNHDYFRAVGGWGMPGSTSLVPGIEVTTTRGHVLVVGGDPPERTERGERSPAEVVERAHERGCAAILAHPYRNSTVRDLDLPFDAVEVNGKHPRTHAWVERLADERGLPLVGGSDARYPFEVGRAYPRVDVADPSPGEVATAIRNGRVEAVVDDRVLHRATRRFYEYVHDRKGHVASGGEPTPGLGAPPE